ncbi:MAG: hypothetical protein BRC25_01165 [Parcubacteria group bacterium SW_6_46_9]|nr:MAG: hypothetical protein BRC25_01165 [Parcubacteria group bacterium SW_6_46_9]
MPEIEALCMTCKHDDEAQGKKNMTNVRIEESDGRYSARGDCPDCGSNMFKFMSEGDAKEFAEEAEIEIESGDDE